MTSASAPNKIDNTKSLRTRFDDVYNRSIIGNGFFEGDEYYRKERERYWRSLSLLMESAPPPPAAILEIGGGQLAILCNQLFGYDCDVADVSNTFSSSVERNGLKFYQYNLLTGEGNLSAKKYDIIVLLEVIEHIPVPAHVVFESLKTLLSKGGILFITTPNLFRIRNLVRMISGVEFLDRFELPNGNEGLGHQLEYSANHLTWQMRRANLEVVMVRHDQLGHVGHTLKARIGRYLAAPLGIRPKWRDGLAAVARKTGD
jgi:hypothetical protein